MARGLRTFIIAVGTMAVTGAAHAQSLGTFRPDGTIGFGLNIVGTPGVAVPVEAAITVPALSGTWRDSAGNTGGFVLTPGAGTGGSPRPQPVATVSRPDGGFVAGGTVGTGVIPATGPGSRMMWHPSKAAFRAGSAASDEWDEALVGLHSVAMGRNTIASGEGSTALGETTRAGGVFSTALGFATTASGDASTAIGDSATATGPSSTAMGRQTTASGLASTAMGRQTLAAGDFSIVMGNESRALGDASVVLGSFAAARAEAPGSFVFGDQSSSNRIEAFVPNQFLARAAGGVGFYTNASLTAGVTLAAGSSAWASVSDVRMKSHFRDLSGEDVLSKLAAMPIREWSYNAQDASIRHVGPTAQDFFAAFGLGEDPLRISTIDADGVALRAIQALEAHTKDTSATQSAELATLVTRVVNLERLLAAALSTLTDMKARAR